MWCVSVFSLLRRGFEREQEKGEREKEGCKGLWEGEKASFHLPRDPRARIILFPSPAIDSVLSLALHPP